MGCTDSKEDNGQYDLRTKKAVIADRRPIGVKVEAGKTYHWCTCGKSKNQPWCDGSHWFTGLRPIEWKAPETKEVYFCVCKQTKNAPFCDGAHAGLPAAPAQASH